MQRRKRRRESGDAVSDGEHSQEAAGSGAEREEEAEEKSLPAPPEGTQFGPDKPGRAERLQTEEAMALGREKGLDNTGLRIVKQDKGPYVEGEKHEGHVHLFANVPDLLGEMTC